MVQYVVGDQRKIVNVSQLIGDEEFSNGEYNNSPVCCVYGNCTCNSLDHALANLTSNVLINITTDVTLSSLIERSDLQNVSITGYNNPTVNCKNAAGIHFKFCHNCIIQGIAWNKCGSTTIAGLMLNDYSNIAIQNCSFQHSLGQVIVLSEVSGNVNINNCNFVNNTQYRDHGTVIHYYSNDSASNFIFNINNCKFSRNKQAKSLIYVENRFKHNNLTLCNATFQDNTGVSIFLVNQKIYLNGKVLFLNNKAGNGTGIYLINHSTVVFGENSEVTFIHNSAGYLGGAILSRNHSGILFNQNSKVNFSNNTAYAAGGGMISMDNCHVSLKGTVVFSNNNADYGGAVYLTRLSNISFEENSITVFTNNTASKYGGAIRAYNSSIYFEGNSTAKLNNDTLSNYGRAIGTYNNSNRSLEVNSIVQFIDNGAKIGGAVYISWFSNIYLKGNFNTEFTNNTARYGGAIYIYNYSNISFGGKSNTEFANNTARYIGGAIYIYNYNNISFEENSNTEFTNNTAGYYGGAIDTYNYNNISFEGNSNTEFTNNTAGYYGGAINTFNYNNISFKGNSNTEFTNNAAGYFGGAISTNKESNVNFEGNSNTQLNNNTAWYGGAIDSYQNSNISFKENSIVYFRNSGAMAGGAVLIWFGNIRFEHNSTTVFNNNTALYYGGAILTYDNGNMFFEGNSNTEFSNNSAAVYGGAVVYAEYDSDIIFDGNSKILLNNNKAGNGATFYSIQNSKVIAKRYSSVLFNNVSAKWCNNICSPDYNSNDVTIDSHGIVRCNYQGGFTCEMKKCYCNEFNKSDLNNDSLIIIKDTVMLSSAAFFTYLSNVSIIGLNNPFVYCVNGSGLAIIYSSNIVMEGITWIGCGSGTHKAANQVIDDFTEINHNILDSHHSSEHPMVSVVHLQFCMNVKIQNCSFQYSEGQAVKISELSGEVKFCHCNFANNSQYTGHGAAIHYSFENSSQYLFKVNDCYFAHNNAKSLVYIENRMPEQNDNISISDSKFYHNQAVSIHVTNQKVHLTGKNLFSNNVAINGSGVYITNHSSVTFGENSDVMFTENIADYKGSAIFLQSNSTIEFDQNSKVTFNENEVTSGTVYSEINSNVIFKGTCKVTFTNNLAEQHGAAIHSFDNSCIAFKGNATVTVNKNNILPLINTKWHGGTIFSEDNSKISFEDNSITKFSNNAANFGASIFLHKNSNINFKDRSRVAFNDNTAINGGAVALYGNCTGTIEQFSNITFTNNFANQSGGALYFSHNCNVSFTDSLFTLFTNNTAENYGGAICFNVSSNIIFEENSTAIFIDNAASFGENLYSNGSSYTDIRNANLIINKSIARWHYVGQFTYKNKAINDIIIDTYGIVRCNDHKAYYICQHKKCYCENIEEIKSNTIVIITKKITLSSPVKLRNIVNVSLIGYNSPSIYCENDGGLQFTSCTNVTITNITWSKIISDERNISNNITSQIKFYNSSNITIDHCTFQQSVGQAVVLSEVSGDVNIKYCKFVNNMHLLRVHGAAIHYSANSTEYCKVQLTISDCYFIDNTITMSLIYFEQHNSNNQCESIILRNSKFDSNKGTCVYLSNTNLYIKGNVLFDNNEAENGAGIFISDHSNVTFGNASNVTFAQNTATINGGAIYVNNWSSVVFEKDSLAMFTNNKATRSGGTIYSYNNSGIILKKNSIASFIYSYAYFGGTIFAENNGFIITRNLSRLTINGSEAIKGGAIFFTEKSTMEVREYSKMEFLNNKASVDGGCIYSNSNSSILFSGNSTTKFYKNNARKGGVIYSCNYGDIELNENSWVWFNHSTAELGGTLYIDARSYIITKGISRLLICNSEATSGGASYLVHSSSMMVTGNSTVTFINNVAKSNGGSIYSTSASIILFSNYSVTKIYNSRAAKGGTIYTYDNSNIILAENSTVWFDHSTASELGGTLYIANHSYITTKGVSTLIVNNSEATNGGVSYLMYSSSMMITETSNITFLSNEAKADGGSIYSTSNSSITFSENSVTNINKNKAARGGAIFSYNNSSIVLEENSQVWFNHNTVTEHGGTLYIEAHSYIITKGTSNLTICNSKATNGGASYLVYSSRMTIAENSTITFLNNEALEDGGGVYSKFNSNIMFKGNSTVTTTSNRATRGGAIYSIRDSNIQFDNNSTVIFNINNATQSGGCIHSERSSTIQFKGTCRVTFNNSVVFNGVGGAIFSRDNSSIDFISCNITFYKNIVYNGKGGAICCTNSYARFEGTSNVEFCSNKATYGGAADFNMNSRLRFENKAVVTFNNNSATMQGGALDFYDNSSGIFEMNSKLVVRDNSALQNGGAFYLARLCYIEFKEFINAHFNNNNAVRGGAIFLMASDSIFKNYSTIMFKNNMASQDGGAIYIADDSQVRLTEGSNVTFYHNRASDYGGAIFSKMVNSKITFGTHINDSFLYNSAGTTGSSVYISLPRRCNSTCLTGNILGMNTDDIQKYITTSPNEIQLNNSEVQCIDPVNDTECDLYYIKNIMLGQKILVNACMYDYYDHSVYVARFLISSSKNQGYYLDSNNTLITCNHITELVSIYGNMSTKFNYSLNISLYDNRQSESKEVLIKLIVELSQCHLGFSYDKKSEKCECYNASEDIIFCSGSSSIIKRGYWFGNVTGKPTTAFCPINYCSFTCCETSNGYYQLSPVRDDQCSSHRSGTACGSCTDGYTLSYDSTECVNVESCTAGQTVLAVLLTVIYWVVMVMLVFGLMYYKVGIGYLYGITYYYSIVDILLSRNMYAYRGLYLTVHTMSSFSKIIPQFLGELCLIPGLEGIDQQFIHYIHPLAVILILIIISLLARRSQRISVFISRGIIHVICLLLLLSYTSIASTSLLLMRSLHFDGIDNVYTYLSPNIEYFHDRHLAYGIVAVLFLIFIVIGLPLLLTLEPFLNHKFNFTKIKPLLDQFQGCYKDKYRCFAGYYMICRLVIITIIIANLSNDFVANYLLIITCGIIALVHLSIKPYNSGILNKMDGIILHLVIFIEALSLFDDYDPPLVIAFSFVLVILPLLMIIGVAIFLHKDKFQKRFRVKGKSQSKKELLMADYHLIVSDDMRENATTCDM